MKTKTTTKQVKPRDVMSSVYAKYKEAEKIKMPVELMEFLYRKLA